MVLGGDPKLHTPDHPPYAVMIAAAIRHLAEEGGSTEAAISGYIRDNYDDLPWGHDRLLPYYLSKLTDLGEFVVGAPGRYMTAYNDDDRRPEPRSSMDSGPRNANPGVLGKFAVRAPGRRWPGLTSMAPRTCNAGFNPGDTPSEPGATRSLLEPMAAVDDNEAPVEHSQRLPTFWRWFLDAQAPRTAANVTQDGRNNCDEGQHGSEPTLLRETGGGGSSETAEAPPLQPPKPKPTGNRIVCDGAKTLLPQANLVELVEDVLAQPCQGPVDASSFDGSTLASDTEAMANAQDEAEAEAARLPTEETGNGGRSAPNHRGGGRPPKRKAGV